MNRPFSSARGVLLCAVCLLSGCTSGGSDPGKTHLMPLSGQWQFWTDPLDTGDPQKLPFQPVPQMIRLPGSTTEAGYGNDVTVDTQWTGQIIDRSWFTDARYEKYRQAGAIKVPFWLTPTKTYLGATWFRKTVEIPGSWKDRRVILFLERAHWTTKVWVDGQLAGMQDSLSSPDQYDLGVLTEGRHELTIRVDNRLYVDVGENAHSVTDHTQTNWNGLIGRMELQAHDQVWIEDVQVYPNVQRKTLRIVAKIRNTGGQALKAVVSMYAEVFNSSTPQAPRSVDEMVDLTGDSIVFDRTFQLGPNAQPWDEFSPAMYRLTVNVGKESKTIEFGLRDFKTAGTQFTINGRPTFLRGTLECCIFPKTGYPPTDVDSWTRIFKIARAHGLNHMRFHSWCPPEAAFQAADRTGFYLSVECASWTKVGEGDPIDQWIYAEGDRILQSYGNHPSFCMLLYGNEPGFEPNAGNSAHRDRFLGDLVNSWKAKDPRRVYSGGNGWPILAENDYDTDSTPRIQHWGEGLKSRINARPPETVTDYRDFISRFRVPMVSHEIGQWCAYPDFDTAIKYTGVTHPYNFDIFRDSLTEHGMASQAHDFLMASGKLQAICYKEDIESALRTRGMGGFQLLDLHDFPGQGTALVGVLDPFWDSKGYITAEEYHRFACETVPLVRIAKRVWTTDETFTATAEVANFGAKPLENAHPEWRLTAEDGAVVGHGLLQWKTLPIGNGIPLGQISAPLASVKGPAKLVLSLELQGTIYRNSWDVWVYPPKVDSTTAPSDVVVADSLNQKALDALNGGGKVLLIPAAGTVKGDQLGKVEIGFSPIFWNTAWTKRQPPHTLGILCDPKNPALSQFPTEFHTNWQWWDLITKSQAMILDGFPADSRPIVQVIDDWVTNRKLGLITEAKVGSGKLLICSIDLTSNLDTRPVARQMLASLSSYMAGDSFDPKTAVELEQVKALFESAK